MTALISIIIPTCRRVPLLNRLLLEITSQVNELDDDLVDITVSDDDPGYSSFRLKDVFDNVNFIKAQCKGLTWNRHSAAANTSSEWILFIDDDCIPLNSWLRAYLSSIARYPNCFLFCGPVLQDRPKMRMDEEAPHKFSGTDFVGCNYMIKRSFLKSIGGFNLSFPFYLEDIELQQRVRRANAESRFCSLAGVIHPWRTIPSIKGKFIEASEYIKLIRFYPEIYVSFKPLPRLKIAISSTFIFIADLFKYKARGCFRAFRLLLIQYLMVFTLFGLFLGFRKS